MFRDPKKKRYNDEENTAVMEINNDYEKRYGEHNRKRLGDEDEEWTRNRRLVKLSTELCSAKSRVNHLESELVSAINKLQEQDIKHQRQLDSLTDTHNMKRRKDEDGRIEAGRMVDECKGMKDENDALKERVNELKESHMKDERQALNQKIQKQLQFDEEIKTWQMQRQKLMEDGEILRSAERVVREEKVELEERVVVLQRRVDEMDGWEGKVHDLQHQLSLAGHQLKESELERSREGVGGMVGCRVEMEDRIAKLQKEVEYHKSLRDNDSLLYEKLNSSESKVHRLTTRNKNMEKIDEENKKLRMRLETFEVMMKKIPNVKTANDIVSLVDQLSSDVQVSFDQRAVLDSSLKGHSGEVSRLEGELERLTTRLHKRQHDNNLLRNNNTKLHNKVALLSMERDSYVSELDSSVPFNNDPSEKLKWKVERMRTCEEINRRMENELATMTDNCARLKAQVEELQESLKKEIIRKQPLPQQPLPQQPLQPQQPQQQPSTSTSNEEVEALRCKVGELEERLEGMVEEQEKLVYEVERGGRMGHYNRTTTKVISMLDNPFSRTRRTLATECQSSKQENQLLKTKLKLAREGSDDLTVRSSNMIASIGTVQEQENLKKKLTSAELLTKRLTENYERVSQSYKHLISTLLGYRVEKVAENTFTVVSSYSDNPQHSFVFKQTNEGDFQLVCNDFLKDYFSDLVKSHITTPSSYPFFMAAVTLRIKEQNDSFCGSVDGPMKT